MADLGEIQVRSDDPEAREHDHVLNRQRDNALHGRGELVEIHIGSHDLRFILWSRHLPGNILAQKLR